MVASVVENIPRIAKEHQKTPQAVVKMENYHHLHAALSRLKIPVLESAKKEVKQVERHHRVLDWNLILLYRNTLTRCTPTSPNTSAVP